MSNAVQKKHLGYIPDHETRVILRLIGVSSHIRNRAVAAVRGDEHGDG